MATKKVTKKAPPSPACKDCKYAVLFAGDRQWFNCHRNPVKHKVWREHWCGEFKA